MLHLHKEKVYVLGWKHLPMAIIKRNKVRKEKNRRKIQKKVEISSYVDETSLNVR
jgi:hypothetical protein